MTRWITRMSFLLVLGAATTVGVAWGLAIFSSAVPTTAWRVPVGAEIGETHDELHVIARGPGRRCRIVLASDPGAEFMEISRSGPLIEFPEKWQPPLQHFDAGVDPFVIFQPLDGIQIDLLIEFIEVKGAADLIRIASAAHVHLIDTTGWPMVALQCSESMTQALKSTTYSGIRFRSHRVPDRANALPLRPILPGFIINTFFYAALWFGLFFAIGFTKRVLRRKRGRCLKCGYDLRGHQPNSPHPQPLSSPQASRRGDLGEREVHGGCPECGWNRASN